MSVVDRTGITEDLSLCCASCSGKNDSFKAGRHARRDQLPRRNLLDDQASSAGIVIGVLRCEGGYESPRCRPEQELRDERSDTVHGDRANRFASRTPAFAIPFPWQPVVPSSSVHRCAADQSLRSSLVSLCVRNVPGRSTANNSRPVSARAPPRLMSQPIRTSSGSYRISSTCLPAGQGTARTR